MQGENPRTPDELWRRLKEWAYGVVSSGSPLPSDEDCRKQAERFARETLGSLPAGALDFYAAEACTMIEEMQRSRSFAQAQR